MKPIGRNVLVALLPPPPKSTILFTEGIGTGGITQRGIVKATGAKCQHVTVGDTVLVRTTLGVAIGDLTLFPENACVARVEE
jgi:hypothetical protein